MKLHFKISFYTHWGQRLMVSGNIPELGNNELEKGKMMTFQGGEEWYLEVDVKRKDLFSFRYKYVLLDEPANRYNEEWEAGREFSLQPDLHETSQVRTSFNDETFSFLDSVAKPIEKLDDTGKKFRNQLSSIFAQAENNTTYMNERINAACTYFSAEIDKIISRLGESPALTDSRENARQYNDSIQNIYGILSQRLHILEKLKLPFDPAEYFMLKSSFILKMLKSDAYAKTSTNKSVNLRNKVLYYKLIDIRNKISENEDIPVYLVANSKSLMEMSDYLPLTSNDLSKIHGIFERNFAIDSITGCIAGYGFHHWRWATGVYTVEFWGGEYRMVRYKSFFA